MKKTDIKKLLKSLETIDIKSVSKKNGTLDLVKLHELSLIKSVIESLSNAGVSKKDLMDKGFVLAGMILSIPETDTQILNRIQAKKKSGQSLTHVEEEILALAHNAF